MKGHDGGVETEDREERQQHAWQQLAFHRRQCIDALFASGWRIECRAILRQSFVTTEQRKQ
jgi:hypothetical protein